MEDEIDIEDALIRAVAVNDFIPTCNLQDSYVVTASAGEETFNLASLAAPQLSSSHRKRLFNILETNVERYYSSSTWGWDEDSKRKELFHIYSKFLIFEDSAKQDVAAFAMFRFEWDDEDEPEHPVLYVYELQVAEEYRSKGLGRRLMELLCIIQRHFGIWKTMLTSFKANQDAMNFYKRIGFGIDVNSPSRCGFEDECYEILSNQPDRK